MNLIKNGNIALAFLLEVCAVFILGYWGFSLPISKGLRILAGIGLPILFIIIWGIWCAPNSSHRLTGIFLVLLKCLLFTLTALCLVHTKHPLAATLFAFLVAVNLGLSGYFGTL